MYSFSFDYKMSMNIQEIGKGLSVKDDSQLFNKLL
jgi:hypothetical protein